MTDRRIIAGVEFEAVRMTRPIPHWLPKVVATDYVYEPGIFNSESRPQLWASMEDMAVRIGAVRFAKEALEVR